MIKVVDYRGDEPVRYDSAADIARLLGVHVKTVSWWCFHDRGVDPDITLGPAGYRGWLPERREAWKRWYRENVKHDA